MGNASTARRIITLDGPAGVGKSTLARRLAGALDLAYLDTGAMFRNVAAHLGRDALGLPEDELVRRLEGLSFSLDQQGGQWVLLCNGKELGNSGRTEETGLLASKFAALPAVRVFLKKVQRALGENFSLVAEGRDMGTEVFPKASRKFFLDATPEVRARRRLEQLAAQGRREDPALLAAQIRERDAQDRNRAIAPLRPAPDALIVDTSDLDIEGVFRLLRRESGDGSGNLP